MSTLQTIWHLLSMIGLLAIPQVLGILIYFRLKALNDFLAHLIGFLVPPVLFLALAVIMLGAASQEIQQEGERVCGTFVGMMSLAILTTTGLQVFVSFIAQLALHVRHKRIAAHSEI